jgi:hypothetical protein
MEKIKIMRGHRLSFFFAALLLVLAFWTKFYDKKQFGGLKDDTGSWFLFLGGIILAGIGYSEYVKKNKT